MRSVDCGAEPGGGRYQAEGVGETQISGGCYRAVTGLSNILSLILYHSVNLI